MEIIYIREVDGGFMTVIKVREVGDGDYVVIQGVRFTANGMANLGPAGLNLERKSALPRFVSGKNTALQSSSLSVNK